MRNNNLTIKQRRFCEEYIKDSNATAAALRAGYSNRRASEIGYQLLQKTTVSAEVARMQSDLSEATGIEVQALVQELAKVAFSNVADILEPGTLELKSLDQLTEAQRAAIQEISETTGKHGTTRKVKLHPKLAAIDMLMKHFGGYVTASDLIDKLPPERLDALVEELLQKLNR